MTENVLAFLRAAAPWISMGLLIAFLCVRPAIRKGEAEVDYAEEGMCVGLCLGLMLGSLSDSSNSGLRTCDNTKSEVGAVHHIGKCLYLTEFGDDVLSHLTDASSVASKSRGKGSLQRHRQSIEADGDNGEEAHRQKALDDIHAALLEIASAGGVFNAALKGADHHADGEQRPGKAGEKENDGADPFQFKKFHAHIAHEGKEIAEKAHDLPVDPIHQLIQNCRGNKVPNKYCSFTSGDAKRPPPEWATAFHIEYFVLHLTAALT